MGARHPPDNAAKSVRSAVTAWWVGKWLSLANACRVAVSSERVSIANAPCPTADNTNSAVGFTATGATGTTLHWTVVVELADVN